MKQSIIYHKIAKHCGVTERYIRMLDKKERSPSMEVAKKIADFLDESIEEIFFNSDTNETFVFER
ncbi:helix-turn-helix transcriptional regulator, partial [Bacillus thuringiensis]|nr:helix-turn-helix transcriptional regulator [Bacillus thuringiensis]